MNTDQKEQRTDSHPEEPVQTEAKFETAEPAQQQESEAAEGAAQKEQASEAAAAELRAELEQARKLAEDNQQRFLRAQADFDNYRKRTQKEKEEFAKYASMKLIEELLPVVDNFERAIAASKDTKDYDSLAKGVDMIFRQLAQVLSAEGLQPMETVGQPFNPEFHQAVMQVESEEHEEGIIVEELQKGYMLKERVLRPAMVKVSS